LSSCTHGTNLLFISLKNRWWWWYHPFFIDISGFCSFISFDNLPTVKEKKQFLKRKHELSLYKRYVSCRYFTATNPLEPKSCLAGILQDCNRAYMKSVIFMCGNFLNLPRSWKIWFFIIDCDPMVLSLKYITNLLNLTTIIICSLYFDDWMMDFVMGQEGWT